MAASVELAAIFYLLSSANSREAKESLRLRDLALNLFLFSILYSLFSILYSLLSTLYSLYS